MSIDLPMNDPWAEHPDHPVADWQAEVANDDTRLGYWDWVAARLADFSKIRGKQHDTGFAGECARAPLQPDAAR